ncbi:MAG: hypothetical protein IPH44_39420 [Myxococcales bacterium]|nr:hypothetical protein [Myxococcales bacterium]MBP6843645.1 hypothetical protein [Kofleriaceae bacterium]
MARFLLLVLAATALAGCDDAVSGELRLTTTVPTAGGTAHATLWEYDPQIADGSATEIARFEEAGLPAGAQVVTFTLAPDDGDGGLDHYVTGWVDVDSDGADEVGDFVVTDFNKVKLGDEGVVVMLAPRQPIR